jgi:PIN domain nuclease of toxin-antitoxin system
MLDASAVLALVQREPGGEQVQAVLPVAMICTVNLAEAVSVLVRKGAGSLDAIRLGMKGLGLTVVGFDEELAIETGALIAITKPYGLSLGDRACLAAAAREGVPVLTTERSWANLNLGVTVQLIR